MIYSYLPEPEATNTKERSGRLMFPFSRLDVSLKRATGKGHVKNPQTIGNHIHNRRLELKLTQKATAAILGVCRTAVARWESGLDLPLLKQRPQIIQFLGYEPECLTILRTSQPKVLQKI